MSVNTPSATDLSMGGETFANDYHWRSTKAKKQLRDRFGRWISLGANVRFRADGIEQHGKVTSVIDGKAYVDQVNSDGSTTQKIIDPGAIRVIASKATLPQDATHIKDPENNFSKALKKPEVKSALDSHKSVMIDRADGYALQANIVDEAQGMGNEIQSPEDPENKGGGNPIMYQLFAPGGRSLGQYGEEAVDDFDDMVTEDQGGGQEADTAPDGSGEAAPAEGAPSGGDAAPAGGVTASGEEKPFRVPENVKKEIQATLNSYDWGYAEEDLVVATRLANDPTVSLSDVEWIHGFFAQNEANEIIRGGYKGRKWASKVITAGAADMPATPSEIDVDAHPKYFFDDDTFAYFAIGADAGSTLCNKLLSVDYETGHVYTWTPDGFSLIEDMDMTEVDEPQIIPIDEMTADEFAHWLDSGTAEEFDILDTDPVERNLFTLADSEIDYDELDDAYSIIAAAGDGVYTPTERSQNAKVQRRGAGGKFGSEPDAKTVLDQVPQDEPKVQKATLPVELPVVEDPAARIEEWMSTAAEAPVVAAGEPSEAPAEAPATDSATPEYTEEDQAAEDAATGPTDEAIYFAIVDDVDKTAVLDAVAIVKSNGTPSAFKRTGGQWVADPDTLAQLQGATPPTVVELPDPETVKNVLEQIDAHDNGADQTEVTEEMAPQPGEVAVAASGFALSDGSYTIIDSSDLQAVVASVTAPDIFVKAHIRKRARALNRMDLVPEDWREFSLAEIGELEASKTVYGEFGEIIVAAGVPGIADAPSDFKNVAKLQAYWTHGKGALKIRWGTKGDLTRAHRHLSKYVGPQRAWGLAQKYHRSLFGVYNHTHDVATGQYVPRKRKK